MINKTTSVNTLQRQTFRTSRLLDFLSEKELVAQIGHPRAAWPLVLVKELLDNALDACEEADILPNIAITVDEHELTITDNGPGIPPDVVTDILDYSIRVSSREAYVSPCRGAQGNALKTVVAMPFVLDGERGHVTIRAQGVCHEITLGIDQIQQKPAIEHDKYPINEFENSGTSITVHLPCSFFIDNGMDWQNHDENDDDLYIGYEDDLLIPYSPKERFLQVLDNFTYLNPHVSLQCDWFGERLLDVKASDSSWEKWKPSDPTSAHWYDCDHFKRLVAAHLSNKTYGTIRELVAEFRGFAGSAKQKKVLDATGLHRSPLLALTNGDGSSLDSMLVTKLLDAMKEQSKPVKPIALGVIGREHIRAKFATIGCETESFEYRKVTGESNGIPWIIETAFGWCPGHSKRRIITGVNWSPGIINPFRELGTFGQSLDSILEQQRAGENEPIVLLLHLTCPRVSFADRGKSSVIVEA